MIDVKTIKPVKKELVKDPIRFPRVIGEFEGKSKKDFSTNLQMEFKMLISEMYKE